MTLRETIQLLDLDDTVNVHVSPEEFEELSTAYRGLREGMLVRTRCYWARVLVMARKGVRRLERPPEHWEEVTLS